MTLTITEQTTNQEIFDYVLAHLKMQNARAMGDPGMCVYKNGEGKSCAIGCLIPDDLYTISIEGKGLTELKERFPKISKYLGLDNPERFRLFKNLRGLHDDYLRDGCNDKDFIEMVHSIAKWHKLKVPSQPQPLSQDSST